MARNSSNEFERRERKRLRAEKRTLRATAKKVARQVGTEPSETHDVLVLEDGFEWNGERRHSLSAIAREITR
jgi:hypothetical protein